MVEYLADEWLWRRDVLAALGETSPATPLLRRLTSAGRPGTAGEPGEATPRPPKPGGMSPERAAAIRAFIAGAGGAGMEAG